MRTELASVLLLTATSLVPMAAGAAQDCGGDNGGKAKETTSRRYDPKLPAGRNICLVTAHLDSNNDSDKDHGTSGRGGKWQTGGRAPNCRVYLQDKGRDANGKKPPFRLVASGPNAVFYVVESKHAKIKALGCGPRDYSITAGYGIFRIECLTNQQWGAKGKSCKENKDCT